MKEFEIAFPVGKEMDMEAVRAAAAKAMGISPKNVGQCVLLRKSLDARNEILYRYRMAAYRNDETPSEFRLEEFRDVAAAEPVIIIGAGPAGMFAALKLLMRGYKPVILERGKDVHWVIERYSRTVKPMYLQFIEPSKRYADIIIPQGGHNKVAIDIITNTIEKSLREKQLKK